MIGRLWKGWATFENAPAYEAHWHNHILPELQHIKGFLGAYVLRHEHKDEVEFVTITLFESLEAVRAFAGTDYTVAVISPEARKVLSRFETTAIHYDVVLTPNNKVLTGQ